MNTYFPHPAEQAVALIEECSGSLDQAFMLADYRYDTGITRREVKWWFQVRVHLSPIPEEEKQLWN